MKVYESFEEIDLELKKLSLERQIAIEELKLTQNQIKDDLAPLNWLNSLMKMAVKQGFSILIVRLIRRL
ncbi:MAG: DUF6327 family protein [Bacteroidota bacterium]